MHDDDRDALVHVVYLKLPGSYPLPGVVGFSALQREKDYTNEYPSSKATAGENDLYPSL